MFGRRRLVMAWLTVGVLGLGAKAWAELIILKDGQRLEGQIVGKTEETIEIKIEQSGISMTKAVRRTQIKEILNDEQATEREKQAAPSTAAAQTEDEDEDEAEEQQPEDAATKAKRKALPIHVDLRMALSDPLLRDSFGSGNEKIEPKRKRYFVLVPFRYEAAAEPYEINRYTIRFDAEHGRPRVKGFVLLEEKAGGGQRQGPARQSEGGDDTRALENMSVALQIVRGEKLYKEITVHQDDGKLMVELQEAPKPKTEEKKATKSPAGRSVGGRSYGRTRSYGSRGGSARTGRYGRPSPGRGAGTYQRDSAYGQKGKDDEEKPAYLKSAYKKTKDKDDAGQGTQEAAESRPAREGGHAEKGEPGSGWAAALLEVPNEAAALTADVGGDGKVPIEVRLIYALSQTSAGSRGRKAEDEQDMLEVIAHYARHESPGLSRLAVARLAELRSPSGSSGRGRAPAKEGTDKRSELIEGAILDALTSKDELTRVLAWQEITSTDTLPVATQSVISESDNAELLDAIFGLIEKDLARAQKATEPSEQLRSRTPVRKSPPPKKGQKASEMPSYDPVGLPESTAAAGIWGLLGALMGAQDDKIAERAIGLALKDGTKQAVTLLGQANLAVIRRAAGVLSRTPNNAVKHQAVRMALSGLAASQGGSDMDVLSVLSDVAKGMAQAGDPLRVTGSDELLMALVPANRDKPAIQLKCLEVLQWCALDQIMETEGMKQWLAQMTDNLVAPENQVATYQLIASKWVPSRLPPLPNPKRSPLPAGASAPQPPQGGGPAQPPRGRPAPTAPPKPDAEQAPTEPQDQIEAFLVQGLETRDEPIVKLAIVSALIRAGREALFLEKCKSAPPEACVALAGGMHRAAASLPPLLVPGLPSRFSSLGLTLGLVQVHEDTAICRQAAGALDDLKKATPDDQAWRLALAFKRRFDWEAVGRLCTAADAKAANQARTAIGAILGLAPGEQTALDGAKDRGTVLGKLNDYSAQRGGKIAGKYHGLILCDVLVPHYALQFSGPNDAEAKERTATVVGLTWSRQGIGVEPGPFEITMDKDRKIEVKLGGTVVGSGQAPGGEAEKPGEKKSLGLLANVPPGGADAKGDPGQSAMARRLAELQRGAKPAAAPTPAESSFALELAKLMPALVGASSTYGKFPTMALVPDEALLKTRLAPKGRSEQPQSKQQEPLTCAMAHLAFGTRQGAVTLGDGKPPTFDNLEVRVDAKGNIIRGAQVVPYLQEVQIFLEPVRANKGS